MVAMIRLGGGAFRMGSDDFYPEEGPVHVARVAPFEIAETAVTNAEFAVFVAATGYRTVAERPLDPADFVGAATLAPGSLVFTPTAGPVDLDNWRQWWRWVPGASWRHPRGPGSEPAGPDHPVVQVAYADAQAYAAWAGARLPTEAEWELAARGGLEGATYAWGETPNDGTRANTWQGRFPYRNAGASGWVSTAPVGAFPPNGYGLRQMTGNTWEWTSSAWRPRHDADARSATASGDPGGGCGCHGGGQEEGSPTGTTGSRVLKGGSHLCAPEYCLRYRPAARSPQTEDSASTHLGFRLARDVVPRA